MLNKISNIFEKLSHIFKLYQKYKIINSEFCILMLLLNISIHLIIISKEYSIFYILFISFILFSLEFIKYKIIFMFDIYINSKLINYLDEIYLINYFLKTVSAENGLGRIPNPHQRLANPM